MSVAFVGAVYAYPFLYVLRSAMLLCRLSNSTDIPSGKDILGRCDPVSLQPTHTLFRIPRGRGHSAERCPSSWQFQQTRRENWHSCTLWLSAKRCIGQIGTIWNACYADLHRRILSGAEALELRLQWRAFKLLC